MNIEPRIGVERFKLGVPLDSPLWDEIGENVPFKRNFSQKNPALRFSDQCLIIYFDNQNLSAAIEMLGNDAYFHEDNLIGLSVAEVKKLLGGTEKDFSYHEDVLTANSLGMSFYIVRKGKRRVVGSVLVFNENYINDNDLAEY